MTNDKASTRILTPNQSIRLKRFRLQIFHYGATDFKITYNNISLTLQFTSAICMWALELKESIITKSNPNSSKILVRPETRIDTQNWQLKNCLSKGITENSVTRSHYQPTEKKQEAFIISNLAHNLFHISFSFLFSIPFISILSNSFIFFKVTYILLNNLNS